MYYEINLSSKLNTALNVDSKMLNAPICTVKRRIYEKPPTTTGQKKLFVFGKSKGKNIIAIFKRQ